MIKPVSMESSKYFTILYVDDEEDNLLSFFASFRRDYTIITAKTANEGLAILKERTVDLVISDQRMPEVTGVQFLEKTRELYPDTIRIIITGYSDIEAVIGAINKGEVYRYITKPWDFNDLRMSIENARQLQKLKKENLVAHYEVLKNQINPHFLFNTLSSLIGLIEENPQKAVNYVQDLAELYRYVLATSEVELTELGKELDLVRTYTSLIEQRFGNNFQINIDVEKKYLRAKIPPLSLQILIENAIKHNVLSSKNPLIINLNIENNCILVRNNVQFKSLKTQSTRIGLKNIKERYRYYTNKEVIIDASNSHYSVSLPLLEYTVTE